jgi:hypothetical protein
MILLDSRLSQVSRADETTSAAVNKFVKDFLADLHANRIDAVTKSVGIPWYNGGEMVEKEAELRTVLGAMAKWYDEDRVKEYQILAVGAYKKLKSEKGNELSDSDIKKMDKILDGNDWLVVIGKIVDGDKRPRLYLLVKERNGKPVVVGAHK